MISRDISFIGLKQQVEGLLIGLRHSAIARALSDPGVLSQEYVLSTAKCIDKKVKTYKSLKEEQK